MKREKPHITQAAVERFTKGLMQWHKAENRRALPWKEEKNPYKIWLSEIMLQQTRAAQGKPYYQRFVRRFPSVEELAKADRAQVLKHWEGLGYYRRAHHLHEAAQQMVNESGGVFPSTYNDILSLKGVGPYSAAAIASFAFNLPHAVVDGNVVRVLSRVFGLDVGYVKAADKKRYSQLAQRCLAKDAPGVYNQAIMDFGATVCKPKAPLCKSCPMQANCVALATDRVALLPPAKPTKKKKRRKLSYLICYDATHVWLTQRTKDDIWKGLYQFVLDEEGANFSHLDLDEEDANRIKKIRKVYRQTLSHQEIEARFYRLPFQALPKPKRGILAVSWKKISTFAYPRIIHSFLTSNAYFRKYMQE